MGKVSVGMSATHEGGTGSVINIDIDMVLRVVEGEREQLQQQDMEAAVARWRPPAGQCWPKLPLGGGMELLATPVAWNHPLSGSLKPIENLFFELLAASRSSQSAQDALRRVVASPRRSKTIPRCPKTAP